jgi:hypothetical protein
MIRAYFTFSIYLDDWQVFERDSQHAHALQSAHVRMIPFNIGRAANSLQVILNMHNQTSSGGFIVLKLR